MTFTPGVNIALSAAYHFPNDGGCLSRYGGTKPDTAASALASRAAGPALYHIPINAVFPVDCPCLFYSDAVCAPDLGTDRRLAPRHTAGRTGNVSARASFQHL